MNMRNEHMGRVEPKEKGTILWLTGWSMTDAVFDSMRQLLPEFQHISVDYGAVSTPEDMLDTVKTTAMQLSHKVRTDQSEEGVSDEGKSGEYPNHAPLIISGWSLGALLALGLAAKGYVDGLVLFSATARFIRGKKEQNCGVSDVYVRQMIRGIAKDPQDVETRFRKMIFTMQERQMGNANQLSPAGSWTPEALLAGLHILRHEEYLSDLAQIDCPVLLFHGDEDKICPYDAGVELLNRLPRARLVTLNDSGHAPFVGEEVGITNEWKRWWHEHEWG